LDINLVRIVKDTEPSMRYLVYSYCKSISLGNEGVNHIFSMLKTTIEASYVKGLCVQPAGSYKTLYQLIDIFGNDCVNF